MRVLLFLSSVLTAQCYIPYPLPYTGLYIPQGPQGYRILPYVPEWPSRIQTPEPSPEIQPVVISGFDDFDCPDVGLFPDEESGCEMYWVCNEAAV